ncbi:hypothetical protein GCM10010519_52810 [Streptomyces lactacystinicus]
MAVAGRGVGPAPGVGGGALDMGLHRLRGGAVASGTPVVRGVSGPAAVSREPASPVGSAGSSTGVRPRPSVLPIGRVVLGRAPLRATVIRDGTWAATTAGHKRRCGRGAGVPALLGAKDRDDVHVVGRVGGRPRRLGYRSLTDY